MKRLKSLALAAGLMLAAGAAQATTITFSQTDTIAKNGVVGSVAFMALEVVNRGRFNIFTTGSSINAQLRMFNDDNANGMIDAGERYIGGDVAGCTWLVCNLTTTSSNASISERWLNVGTYIFAVADARFTIAEARSGINGAHPVRSGLNLAGDVTTWVTTQGITTNPGIARLYTPMAPVPLPAGGLLLLGAIGALGARRGLLPKA